MRIIAVACGWLLGLFAGSQTGLPLWLLAPGLALLGLASWRVRRHWRWLAVALLAVGTLAGALRFELADDAGPGGTLHLWNGAPDLEVRGIVDSYPERLGSVTPISPRGPRASRGRRLAARLGRGARDGASAPRADRAA